MLNERDVRRMFDAEDRARERREIMHELGGKTREDLLSELVINRRMGDWRRGLPKYDLMVLVAQQRMRLRGRS